MSPTRSAYDDPPVATSEPVADEVKYTTCYMCACRCGIRVHLKDGGIRYIEGNRDHPVNHGVLCAKGSAGIMKHYSPARLTQAAAAHRRARQRRVPRDRVGGGARHSRPSGSATSARPIRKQARVLHRPRPEPVASPAGGPRSSARPTSPRMAASARSTWRPAGSTRSAARSGSSASRTGSAPNTS